MENLIKKIVKEFLVFELGCMEEAKDEKDLDTAHVYYGEVMGKIDLLPYLFSLDKKYKDEKEIGTALYHIYHFTNYLLCEEVSKPQYYDAIMEVLNEDKSE